MSLGVRAMPGCVLVLMPTRADGERTAGLLQEAGIASTVCRDVSELCQQLRGDVDGVVTTDDAIATDSAGQLAETLRDQPPWSSIPFVLITREGSAERVQQSSLALSWNVVVVERPVRIRSLVSVVHAALRGRRHQREIHEAMLVRERQAAESARLHEALQISQAQLARHAEQLRSNDRRKDDFLATLAHELRNPLAPIRTGMDVLDASMTDAEDQRTLGVMRRQLDHLVRLIDDLLDISRITRGKLELRRERVTVGTILSLAIEASRPQIDRGGHSLIVAVEDPDITLDADPTRIAQVVANLLHNASKYTAAGGHIAVSVSRSAGGVAIEVADDGVGIPVSRLEEIFEMFSQVDSAIERAQGGLGIGLALVRSLVEMHGGVVSARSDGPGTGSRFRVELPAADPAPVEANARPSPPPRPSGGAARILVVDDNVDAADLLCVMLQRAGYVPTAAYDSESALTEAVSNAPDVVILDIGLPGMNGYEVARTLRQTRQREELGLIALTGWGTAEDRRKAMDAGFDVHLTKPVDANMLRDALNRVENALVRHGTSHSV